MMTEQEYLREQAVLARAAMRHTAADLKAGAKQRVDQASAWIEAHPLLALGGAAAASTVLGAILGRNGKRRAAPPPPDRFPGPDGRHAPLLESLIGPVRTLIQNLLLGLLTGLLAADPPKPDAAPADPPSEPDRR